MRLDALLREVRLAEAEPAGKVFKIKWVRGYGDADGKSETHPRAWFDEDVGVSREDQAEMDRMGVGDKITLGGPMDRVQITRMKDGAKVTEGRDPEGTSWTILLHPGGGGSKVPYPEDQVAALVKHLQKSGEAKVLRSTAKDLEIALALKTADTEDGVWELIGSAPGLDDELDWGGSVRRRRAPAKKA